MACFDVTRMASCRHETLDNVGDQRTDDCVNTYYKCKPCGDLLVVTPSRNVIGIKGVQRWFLGASGRSAPTLTFHPL